MLPINKKISAYNHYNGNDIKYIAIHYVGENSTAKNNVDYFSGGDRGASAHIFVDNTSIWQSVEFENGAWHIGNTQTEVNNKNSIGIEMCLVNGVVTDVTEANTVELVKYLMVKYGIGINNVRTHYEITKGSKVCPNWSDNNWARWTNFKNKLKQDEGKYKLEDDTDMTIKFSGNWYGSQYPDVVRAYGNSESELYKHYVDYGKAEGRLPIPPIPEGFTITGYLQCNPDLQDALNKGNIINIFNHYLSDGFKENRNYIYTPPVDQSKEVEELKKQLEEAKKPITVVADDSNKQTYFRVVTGAYSVRKNADDQIEKLKEAGFESFVNVYKK